MTALRTMTNAKSTAQMTLTRADMRWIEATLARLLDDRMGKREEWLTTEQVCRMTGNKPAWVTRHRHELGAVKRNGRNYVPKSNLLEYIKKG